MICPRCSLNIQPTATNHCPSCGQPLYAPLGQEPRVIRIGPEPTPGIASAAQSFDSAVWPALDTPIVASPMPDTSLESELESGQRIPLASFDAMPGDSSDSQPISLALSEPTERIANLPTVPIAPKQPAWSQVRSLATSPNKRLMIVLGLIVVLALITGGMMYLVNAHMPGGASNPALAQKHPTATAMPTATATATPAPTATATALPTATATPAPHLVTLFSDPLTSNTNGWPNQNGCSFESDGYHVTGGAWCAAPVAAQSDTVNISVQMTFTANSYSFAGIGFRIQNSQPDQSYIFLINPFGYCSAADRAGNTFFNTTCSSVHQGQGAVNTLTINQNGAHMDFYVNGTLVGSANDGTFSSGGIALTTQGHRSDVIFSNFTLTQWQ